MTSALSPNRPRRVVRRGLLPTLNAKGILTERSHHASQGRTSLRAPQQPQQNERHCSLPAVMQITVGSYVRINEQCRNRAVRGLLCRVQALECRRLSAIVPTQFAQVRVLGLEEHIQGDAPEWWTPCSAIRYVGDALSCIGTHDGQAAARCFLPFQLSTGAIECSLEVPQVPSRMASVAARLRQARACSHILRGRVSVRQDHTGRRTSTPLALPILLPSEVRRLSAHEAQLATGGVSLLHRTCASITHGERMQFSM